MSAKVRAASGLLAAMAVLAGCAGVQPLALFHDHSSLQLQRLQSARNDLDSLESVDVLIRLDNSRLTEHIQAALDVLARDAEQMSFDGIQVRFSRQYITLEATAAIPYGEHAGRKVSLHGDVIIMFSGNGILWQPQFFILESAVANGHPDDPTAVGLDEELKARWLSRINAEMSRRLRDRGGHFIAMDTMPLGILEVGASEARVGGNTTDAYQHLQGVFTTAGSAILIEPSVTSIALDLNFVPRVLNCPATVTVSRVAFAREIRDREPVGISQMMERNEDIVHFFTEIAGAKQPLAIAHYWFADGQPAFIEELEVQPSERWRTWSSRDVTGDSARNWEVIVVEKDTGCILDSMSILSVPEDLPPPAPGDRAAARDAFNAFREEFTRMTGGFSISGTRPEIALIEAPKSFIASVLNNALRELELVAYLQIQDPLPREFNAVLENFQADRIKCEKRECGSDRECIVDYDRCPAVPRDNSSCVTCLFRNPLNNRCITSGRDPSCVYQRVVRNSRLARNHESCVEDLQAARERCERLRIQEIRSCEMEADSVIGACESNRALVESLQGGGPVAEVRGTAQLAGNLRLDFSGFRYDKSLERLRMAIGLHAEIGVSGELEFEPADSLASMRECIAGWRGDYSSLVFLPQTHGGLIGLTEAHGSNLITHWSGVVHPVELSPSPLESVFVSNPGMLADCEIGLTVSQVSSSVTGTQGRFFNGQHELGVQPLPTQLGLLPASIRLGDAIYAGEAKIGPTHLRYMIGD